MTREEAKQAIEELKAQGFSEDEMLLTFYTMFQDDKLNVDQLGNLVGLIGYELSEEFLAMSPEDQKTKGYEEAEDAENLTKEEIEDAKEVEPEEKNNASEPKGEEAEETEDASEDDEEKAKKLFGIKDWK